MAQARKTVLITGCSSGVGRASALLAAQRGHRVLATARQVETLREIAEAHPALVTALTLDVADPASVAACAEQAFALTGGEGPDVVVNNAGFSAPGPVECVPFEVAKECFETNTLGALAVTQAFLPAMRRRRSGRIVNVSSIAGLIKVPYEGVYAATKHALEALTDALRFETAPFGIEVVAVQFGPLNTTFETRYARELAKLREDGGEYRPHLNGFLSHRRRAIAKGPPAEAAAQIILRAIEADRPPDRIVFPTATHGPRLLFAAMPARTMRRLLRAAFGVPARAS